MSGSSCAPIQNCLKALLKPFASHESVVGDNSLEKILIFTLFQNMFLFSEYVCKVIVIFMKTEVTVRKHIGGSDTRSRSKKIDGYVFVYTNANHTAWLFYHISFHLL